MGGVQVLDAVAAWSIVPLNVEYIECVHVHAKAHLVVDGEDLEDRGVRAPEPWAMQEGVNEGIDGRSR